jgi:starch synthase
MNKKLSIAFLWHMHQPFYKDRATGEYVLPWVRLHSTFSYYDMASVLAEYPEVKVTFNLTPSLLLQLEDLSGGAVPDDRFLRCSATPPSELSPENKIFAVKNFFTCDHPRSVEPSERYSMLSRKQKVTFRGNVKDVISSWSDDEIRDLQVHFNLAWCGFTLRKKDPFVGHLVEKDAGYTEEEKRKLLEIQMRTVSKIIPLYRELLEKGDADIITSPFYHPIMPVLCRKEANGQGAFGTDAEDQLDKALEYFEKVFGRPPSGIWPPEGALSDDVISLLSSRGMKWAATDEGLLRRSSGYGGGNREDLLCRAYTVARKSGDMALFFRDPGLSNSISFRYSGMSPERACEDLFIEVSRIKNLIPATREDPVLSVILDGENPWPYFPDGGEGFLRCLYSGLSSSEDLNAVTFSEWLLTSGQRTDLSSIHTGSWINADLGKWEGRPEKDAAWRSLRKTRSDVSSVVDEHAKIMEEIYTAEGSDWFWWYDEFNSELDLVFDGLFRKRLSNIYHLAGKNPPGYLTESLHKPETSLSDKRYSGAEMAGRKSILLASSEVFPFARTGGLGDVCGSLPGALASAGYETRVIMPFYKCVKDKKKEFGIERIWSGLKVFLPGTRVTFDLYSCEYNKCRVYFVDFPRYFDRKGLYGHGGGDYADNAERFSFFCKAVLTSLESTGYRPDLIHCNDWQTALLPLYLRFFLSNRDFYRDIKTLYTIHNLAYQGIFSRSVLKKAGIPETFFSMHALEFYGKVNFMKSGILYADGLSTVSRCYAEEISTPEYGCGLDGLIRSRKKSLYGILNGVDYSIWSPSSDKYIKANYDLSSVERKSVCKKDLLAAVGAEGGQDAPLIGFVGRLARQKGIDIITASARAIVRNGGRIIVLGEGDASYARSLERLSREIRGRFFFIKAFDDELAHKIEAGCDIFIMPSRYEPCGLNQIYSIKYGTVPVVRATGGLDDVIIDYGSDRTRGNGFKFSAPDADSFISAVERALTFYSRKDDWSRIIKNCMIRDFSWERSAEKYIELYNSVISGA